MNTVDEVDVVLNAFFQSAEPFTPRDVALKLAEAGQLPIHLHVRTVQLEKYIDSMFRNGAMPGWAQTLIPGGPRLYFKVPEIVYSPPVGTVQPGKKGASRKSNKDAVIAGINALNNKLIELSPSHRQPGKPYPHDDKG